MPKWNTELVPRSAMFRYGILKEGTQGKGGDMKSIDLVPNVEKLEQGDTPIPFFASSSKMGEFLAQLLSTNSLDKFAELWDSPEWRSCRAGAKQANPLIKAMIEGARRRDGGGFTDEFVKTIAMRAFVVRTDDRAVSDLGLRLGLGIKMANDRKDGYELSAVDALCGGKRLPQLKSNSYRHGRPSVNSKWIAAGLIEANGPESRYNSRKVLCADAFPCVVEYPANKYPCMDERDLAAIRQARPFSARLMTHMRDQVESQDEHAILRFTPGARLLAKTYGAFVDMLSGFDYERRELRILRPHGGQWETIALFGVLETSYGINLIGYLLDPIVENGSHRVGASEMVNQGLSPLWRSFPVRERDVTACKHLNAYRMEFGDLLEEREDWDVIGPAIQSGRAVFLERRNYMCAASTDRMLRVRITFGREGLGRFQRIAHAVETRRVSLLKLMPSGSANSRGPRRGMTLPTISPLAQESGTFVYEDWVVGRKAFTRFLRRNMDVIEKVEAWYQSDAYGTCQGEEYEQAFNLEDYYPRRTKPGVRSDPYATGYQWSAYRVLQRYEDEQANGAGYLCEEDRELLNEAKGCMDALRKTLEGADCDVEQ